MALLALRPPRAGLVAFGAFAVLSGIQQALGNLGSWIEGASLLLASSWGFMAVAPTALVLATTRYTRVSSNTLPWAFVGLAAASALTFVASPGSMLREGASLTDLGVFLWLLPYLLSVAVATTLIARAHRRAPSDELRIEALVLMLALLPYLAYTSAVWLFFVLLGDPAAFAAPWAQGYVGTALVGLAVVAWVCIDLWRSGDKRARALALASVAAACAGAVQMWLVTELTLFGGALRILAALLLGYGLAKYGLFGTELKLKWTLARGALLGIFAVAFFLVDQAAQFFVSATFGALAGLAAAVILVFALAPLKKLTHRLADRAMPAVEPTDAYLEKRRLVVYKAALQSAAQDGVVTEREARVLDTLARELGLTADETTAIARTVLPQPA